MALVPRPHQAAFTRGINRDYSPVLALGVPWLSVLLGSLTPWLPVIAAAPVMPPFALMLLLAWRLLRPGLFPLWAGLPLGLFDDLYSGQPLGNGILLFSLVLLATEWFEFRFPWRTFLLNWAFAAAALALAIVFAAIVSGARLTSLQLAAIAPQVLISIVLFPLVARFAALLDRLRLTRVRRID